MHNVKCPVIELRSSGMVTKALLNSFFLAEPSPRPSTVKSFTYKMHFSHKLFL